MNEKKRKEQSAGGSRMVYCLDTHRLLAADDRLYVFTTAFRTCRGINYPIAVRRESLRPGYLMAVSD
jgi:hypothetical protein